MSLPPAAARRRPVPPIEDRRVSTARKATKKAASSPAKFSAGEQAAMKERARELKAEAKAGKDRAAGEQALLASVAEMAKADRDIATRLHQLIGEVAPALSPKTWYGMPAYARDGKVLCFFQGAKKFNTRYATLGFSDQARLDDGSLWPTAYALTAWTSETEAQIRALLQRAAH